MLQIMATWLVVVMLLAQTGDRPTARDRDVRQGVTLYEDVDFRGARKVLERALDRGKLSRRDREIALAYLARCFAAMEQRRRAEKAFQVLLDLNPEFRVSADESPRIRAAFAAARELAGIPADPTPSRTPAPPSPDPEPPDEANAGPTDEPPGDPPPPRNPPPQETTDGWEVSEETATAEVAAVDPLLIAPPDVETRSTRPKGAPWAWIGAGVGIAAIAGSIALVFLLRDEGPQVDHTWNLD